MNTRLLNYRIPGEIVYKTLCYVIYVYFFLRLLFYAVNISPHIPPDEIDHFGKAKAFAQTWLLPQDSPATYEYGLISHYPYLYYYLMGFFLKFNISGLDDLVFLRVVNCLLTMLFVLYAHLWLRLISENRLLHVLVLLLLTNTPMFTFIGAAVSYDNLSNLTALMSLYYMHKFFEEKRPRPLILFGIALAAGWLTKYTSGIIVLLMLIIFLNRYRKERFKVELPRRDYGVFALLAVFLLLVGLNVSLYGGNLWKFGGMGADAKAVMGGEENFMKSPNYAEGAILSDFNLGKISYEQAVEKARKYIKRETNLMRTLYYLSLVKDRDKKRAAVLDPISYTEVWFFVMMNATLGILGHESLYKAPQEMGYYHLAFFAGLLMTVRYWRRDDARGYLTDGILMIILYMLIVLYGNYNDYLQHLSAVSGIQGRYVFRVIVPLYGVFCYYLLKPLARPWQLALAAALGFFFVYGDLPFFLARATPEWFMR
ncbi:MAG TPA: glycosyltransferase family 39 protein [Syntrophales bacterium]|nr:glycosyltransferase family 39 protein [Syntrophales bacterium]HOM07706.1 glycosyltransferase family 39 protein [Syntrophales bacterium]HOO00833.1 glycosyltransferase family 39 protein [Syntrophales bacterium]HPQ07230.1 glycosyltransferase family 39 protein [Syntrophales bacterium]HRV42903.1 glycosyltransferase family 39 protein [Syntrophales bacterium]